MWRVVSETGRSPTVAVLRHGPPVLGGRATGSHVDRDGDAGHAGVGRGAALGQGRPPAPRIEVRSRTSPSSTWTKLGRVGAADASRRR